MEDAVSLESSNSSESGNISTSNSDDNNNILASYNISGTNVQLNIVRGSVLDFNNNCTADNGSNNKNGDAVTTTTTTVGAIVNAANEGCLGGGGVDGAISAAGGESLLQDRINLPILEGEGIYDVRCPVGDAKITGPNQYGNINVPYVIHAVGPNYSYFEEYKDADNLLRSAYRHSLECCITDTEEKDNKKNEKEKKKNNDVQDKNDNKRSHTIITTTAFGSSRKNPMAKPAISRIAFSLLSAGIFRGSRTLYEVLEIGIIALRDWILEKEKQRQHHSLSEISMFAFTPNEAKTLIRICNEEL